MADTLKSSKLYTTRFEAEIADTLGLSLEEIKGGASKYSPSKTGVGKISPTLTKIMKKIASEEVAIGKLDTGETVVEMPTGNEGQFDIAVYNPKDGKLKCSTYDKDTNSLSTFEVGYGKRNGSALYTALLPTAIEDEEITAIFHKLLEDFKDISEISDVDEFKRELAIFSDNIYYRVKENKLKFEIPETKRLAPVKMEGIESGIYTPVDVLNGKFEILTSKKIVKTPTEVKVSTISEYTNTANYSDDMKKMIPAKRGKGYTYAKQTITAVKYILETTKYGNMAYRNMLFIGCPGSGKTTAAEDIASILQCPKLTFSCNANTTGPDFAGYVIPASTEDETPTISVEDMIFDPEGSYKLLSGEKAPIGVTEAEVIDLYLKKQQNAGTGIKYNVVLSPICQAQMIDDFIVVEIQEVANIVQPGAISALNSILEPAGTITAPDGTVLRRNLNCIFVLTMNDTTKASRGLDEAILSRMQYVPKFDTPSNEELRDRALYLTGCKDTDMVEEMVRITSEVNQYLIDNELSGGSCGARELYNWIISTMITEDPIASFEDTILQKATSDKEERDVIRSTFLESSSFYA